MIKISKESVFEILNDGGTHRKQFSQSSGVQKNKKRPTFSVPFDNGLVGHFQITTGKRLSFKAEFNQHYCFLTSPEEIAAVEAWEVAQGTRVFIRNSLTSTVALDLNFRDNESGVKTLVGTHEEAAKHYQSEESIRFLVEQSRSLIGSIDHLARADFICGVPAPVEKGFDLPTRIASDISKLIGRPSITECFSVVHKPKSLKSCTLEEKWDAWAATKIDVELGDLCGKSVVVVDDKYQSGVTLQFVAGLLQQYGCKEVHGLCMVKTLRDTDNIQLVDD